MKPTKPLPFPERLRRLRESAGLSQRAAAIAVGVAQQAYQGWETGRSEPRLSNLRAIASAFGVTVAALAD